MNAQVVTTLYIGNLPWSVTEQDLFKWVSPYGHVKGARIIMERETGRSRGFGFVEAVAEDAPRIVEALNGAELGGRVVTVNEARARQRQQQLQQQP